MDFRPSFTFVSIINLLGIAQALFFSFLLATLKNRATRAHAVLAVFLLGYALVILDDVLVDTRYLLVYPHLSLVLSGLIFTLGPLLYFYVLTLTQPAFQFRPKHGFHFIPLILFIGFITPYLRLNESKKRQILLQDFLQPDQGVDLNYVCLVHVFIYLLFGVKSIRRYSRNLKGQGATVEIASLNWLVSLMLAFATLWVIWLLNTKWNSPFFSYAEAVLFTVFIYAFGIKGIRQTELFATVEAVDSNVPITAPAQSVKKYEKAGIPPDKVQGALLALQQQMEVEKVYRNNQLSLTGLADLLHIPSHHLSQLLNEYLQSTFYEYVNRYRIEDVKAALGNPKKDIMTILGMAWEAGFNSKASFNNAFKKHTGLSPSAYKAQITKRDD